jgi:hypothetical protein
VSLLGPPPPQSPEAETPRYQLIHHTADRQAPTSEKDWKTWTPKQEVQHAGNSGLNSPDYQEILKRTSIGNLHDAKKSQEKP